ncbi:hypothetical protein LCGC14_0259280 [marine sediment metagenome]|uniref:Uncharacterized protein n=1 Tax=marine sediment metagenome TaxID=412755 RepID=A0A0F9X7C0_9ZZZZ
MPSYNEMNVAELFPKTVYRAIASCSCLGERITHADAKRAANNAIMDGGLEFPPRDLLLAITNHVLQEVYIGAMVS